MDEVEALDGAQRSLSNACSMDERKTSFKGATRAAAKRPAAAVAALAPDASAVTETHLQLLRLLEDNPELSQRELAHELGISVGKINYCVSALLARGWIKARNFKNSRNKLAYAYLLTPSGIEQKAALTVNFLRRKLDEYERLHQEIAELRAEVGPAAGAVDTGAAAARKATPKRRSTDIIAASGRER